MFLNILVVAFCVTLSQQAGLDLTDQLDEQNATECITSSGVQLQELQQMDQDPEGKTWKPSHEIKCFLKCAAEKRNLICPDGTVNKTMLYAMAEKGKPETECMKNPPKIVECEDLDKLNNCLSS